MFLHCYSLRLRGSDDREVFIKSDPFCGANASEKFVHLGEVLGLSPKGDKAEAEAKAVDTTPEKSHSITSPAST